MYHFVAVGKNSCLTESDFLIRIIKTATSHCIFYRFIVTLPLTTLLKQMMMIT